MALMETVFNDEDLKKLESVIRNVKDPNARKKLAHLQRGLKRKVKDHQEAIENHNRRLKTAYIVAIPFAILFAIIGVYYFSNQQEKK